MEQKSHLEKIETFFFLQDAEEPTLAAIYLNICMNLKIDSDYMVCRKTVLQRLLP